MSSKVEPVAPATRWLYLVTLIVAPLVILAAAVPVAWGRGIGWLDVVLAVAMYAIGIMGITAGYHRHFTHRAFKARRGLRITLGLAGGSAMEGPISLWAAEHRRHHQCADKPGDPHSPWRFGTGRRALLKGLWHAQVGWFYQARTTSVREHYVPDLLRDPDVRRLDRYYWLTVLVSMLLPAVIAGLLTQTFQAALSAFFWAGLVRYAVVHHVTWSVNSIAHAFGERHYQTHDQSRDVWWVALLTFGEGWHNFHHAAPSSARHGALPGQFDLTAVVIRGFERLNWVSEVNWPSEKAIKAKLLP